MWPQNTKNYLQQMKRTQTMNKINKEKEMQNEIMMLKNENAQLKEEIRQFADWMWIIVKQLKESTRENAELRKKIDAFAYKPCKIEKFIS